MRKHIRNRIVHTFYHVTHTLQQEWIQTGQKHSRYTRYTRYNCNKNNRKS